MFQITTCTQLKPQGQHRHHSFCFQTMFMIMMMRPTAALDTTIFWSHSIKTSRNVTFRLSVACRTFPGKGDKIMISKSNWNFVCWTDLTSLHKKAYKYAYADNHVCVGLFINPGCVFWLVWSKASKM